jgi:hypothetical protein
MFSVSLSAMERRSRPDFAIAQPHPREFADRCPHCGCEIVIWLEEGPQTTPIPPFSDKQTCCALCRVSQSLERSEIDREAVVIWLPEFTQGALNALVHRIHRIAATRGKPVYWSPDPLPENSHEELLAARSAYAALIKRSELAKRRVGTSSPRDLAEALSFLSPGSYARRSELLGGVRLLSLGRFFVDGRDIYPRLLVRERLASILRR